MTGLPGCGGGRKKGWVEDFSCASITGPLPPSSLLAPVTVILPDFLPEAFPETFRWDWD